MVKSLFKNRYWWANSERNDIAKANFMWTQIKNPTYMETLLCKYPERKSGLPTKMNSARKVRSNSSQLTPSRKNKDLYITGSAEKGPDLSVRPQFDVKLYNKIEDNFHIANKKALLLNMTNYYDALGQNVFDNLPLTFHIKKGLVDKEFAKFKQFYEDIEDEIKLIKTQRMMKKKD